MPKVSVIIPIYNVEKYLRRCLESIYKQTLKDIEVICINDGSTDNSMTILKDFKIKDKRIKVISKENEGVSKAKNIGLSLAKGKYVCFIDSDDYIENNMLEIMVKKLEDEECDIAISGYRTIPDNNIVIPLYKLNKKMSPIELIESSYKVHSHNDLCFSWRYIFKREILIESNVKFKEDIKIGEDFIFNLEAILSSNYVYVLNEVLYNYRINNETSAMKMPYKKFLEKNLIKQYEIKKELSIKSGLYKDKNYKNDLHTYYISSFLPMVLRNIYNGPESNKRDDIRRILNYKMFTDSFKEIGYSYKTNNYKEYIAFLIMKYRIYPFAYKILDKQYRVK